MSAVNMTLFAFAAECSAALLVSARQLPQPMPMPLMSNEPSSTQRQTLPHGIQQQTRHVAHGDCSQIMGQMDGRWTLAEQKITSTWHWQVMVWRESTQLTSKDTFKTTPHYVYDAS